MSLILSDFEEEGEESTQSLRVFPQSFQKRIKNAYFLLPLTLSSYLHPVSFWHPNLQTVLDELSQVEY